ncbi:MAG: aminodeoxychorismate synthase, component I [Alphaproteobacteria bacterium]|nr:MAG: aminodeoxychorismate synthase, component I [Alphaproteobacteria bacterium]
MGRTQKPGGDFSVYLDNSRAEKQREAAYLFEDPVRMIVAENSADIDTAFEDIRRALAEGHYLAGWISYETGLYLEDKLTVLAAEAYDVPFLCFGVYKNRSVLSSEDSEDHWAAAADRGDYELGTPSLNIPRSRYDAAVAEIDDYLKAGDIYQVNFTLKSLFDFTGSAASYFAALRQAQRVEYGAFIKAGSLSVLSLSPELFFRKSGREIITRPMKGTCARGRTETEDRQNSDFMQGDEKNRAENLMIVDLLRNDMARIASPGSVKLKSLYDVEKYGTLFQMTSTIEAEVPEHVDVVTLVKTLFPCGSVTGAPKIRAMEIISQLENAPRGIYTGAIGFIEPDGDCCFSVPIRTITLKGLGQGGKCRGEMGIGSAIVADSDAGQEYDECLLKAQFAIRNFKKFDLIESLRWSQEAGFYLLGLHMDRLTSSAEYFGFACDEKAIVSDLNRHGEFLDPRQGWKIRLLLSRSGEISIMSTPLELSQKRGGQMVTLSDKPVDSQNNMLFHKTTDRTLFDEELACHQQKFGSYDVIFLNEAGELTEGTFNNIFLKQGNSLYTPPVTCGLLNGTLRLSLLEDPTIQLEEKRLSPADLQSADKIYLGNSVRGLVEVFFKS